MSQAVPLCSVDWWWRVCGASSCFMSSRASSSLGTGHLQVVAPYHLVFETAWFMHAILRTEPHRANCAVLLTVGATMMAVSK